MTNTIRVRRNLLVSACLIGLLTACSDTPTTNQVKKCIEERGSMWVGQKEIDEVLAVRKLDAMMLSSFAGPRYRFEFEADIRSSRGNFALGYAEFFRKESGWVCTLAAIESYSFR